MPASDASVDDKVLVITRIFEAPRDLVWNAWADPKQALQWAGPREYPAVSVEGDFRVGGKYRTVLKSVETGELLAHSGVYRDIVKHKLISFTFIWDEDRGLGDMLVTLTFEDAGKGRTKFTLRQEPFATVMERDGHNGGWNSAFDRLEEHLQKLPI
ncbi:ATPase [Terrihabitans soli]|uniref:ATPase n=1 Tax=Terrihabitans soli TaxID=708113 RepID=A0A6S6QP06_9HYPH|nr:SRPBCC domain-containing protein [Terrihabitans soli]BCJ90689.1 ATPase [Terrihabitans soli]